MDTLDPQAWLFLQHTGLLETCWILDTKWCMVYDNKLQELFGIK